MQAEFGRAHLVSDVLDKLKNVPASFLQDTGFASSFVTGFQGVPYLLPNLTVPGYFGGGELADNYVSDNTWDAKATFTKIVGAHSFTFGGDYTTIGYNGYQEWPSVSFATRQTGNPENSAEPGSALASFLLAVPDSAAHYLSPITTTGGKVWALFFQDTWKVTSRLTMNVGLRYDKTTWPVVGNTSAGTKARGVWDLETGNFMLQAMAPPCSTSGPPCIPTPDGSLPAHVYVSPDGKLVHDTPTNWGPRLGLAYRLAPRTTIRGSFGIFYDNRAGVAEGLGSDHGTWPASPTSGSALNLNVPTAENPTPTISALNPFPTGTAGSYPSPTGFYSDVSWFLSPHMRTPYSQQWNFGVQHQFSEATLLAVDYAGAGSRRVEVGSVYNTALTPGPGPIKPRQLFPYYTQSFYDRTIGKSDYNALEVTLTHRLAHGLSYVVAYTWSHSIDDACTGLYAIEGCSIQHPYNLNLDRGTSAIDLTHVLSVSALYQDPFGKGRRFSTGNHVLDYIIGNWQLNNILYIRSGQPYSLSVAEDVTNTGLGSVRPNQVGNWKVSNPTPAEWFNAAAFAVPTLYTYGNVGRDSMRTPAYWNLDTSLFRQIPIREDKRLEIRVEAFNLFNNVIYGGPNAGVLNPSFGAISSIANTPRELQLALKLVF